MSYENLTLIMQNLWGQSIGHFFERSNIQLDSEEVRTKTIETRWNECENYLHIFYFPLSLSSLPHYQAEF